MRVQPEHIRKAAMNKYAELQILKLKIMTALLVAAALKWWLL